jgi:hypothetical protein
VDVAGARALAKRIAEGKPTEAVPPELPSLDPPFLEASQKPETEETPEIEVVAIRPRPFAETWRPWVYVRTSGGRLRRAR